MDLQLHNTLTRRNERFEKTRVVRRGGSGEDDRTGGLSAARRGEECPERYACR